MPAKFICPRGCILSGSSSDEKVGHYCPRSMRIGRNRAWVTAVREDLVEAK